MGFLDCIVRLYTRVLRVKSLPLCPSEKVRCPASIPLIHSITADLTDARNIVFGDIACIEVVFLFQTSKNAGDCLSRISFFLQPFVDDTTIPRAIPVSCGASSTV